MKTLACACALVVLVCLQRLESVSGNLNAPICGLPGYNVSGLSLASYWQITLPKARCLRPQGVSELQIKECNFLFSICHPLPEAQCPQEFGLSRSVCQVVTLTDNTTQYYNQGFYNLQTVTYTVGTNESRDGFFSGWNGSIPQNTPQCNHTLSTLIFFECDQSANWDPSSPPSAKYVSSILIDCKYLITVAYSGACLIPPTLAPSTCSLPPYNIETLAKRDYWSALIDPQLCIGGSASFTCMLDFAFCHSLPQDITTASPCSREPTSVCQTADEATGSAESFSLGRFNQSTHFFQKKEEGVGGFTVEYTNGSSSTACPNGSRTVIEFNCNSTAVWKNQDVSQYTRIVNIPSRGVCEFLINVNYSGACIPVGGLSTKKVSPVGWILMGIFLFVVLSYFIVGSAYQYFAVGARGLEIIPNVSFWITFWKLVLEGCAFSLSVITCYSFGERSNYQTINTQYDKI